MKSKIKNFSTGLLAVALTLCLLASCITGGCITAGAAATETDPVGRGAGYILFGTNDDPSGWSDTGAVVTVSGSTYTATIPKRKFTQTGMNYYIAISSSTSPGDMFFQNDSITVTANGSWFSGSGSQSRDQYRFARISFSVEPTSDIRLQVNTGNNSYTFSYTADETTYGVTVLARTGGQVVTNGVTVNGGNAATVAVGTSPVSISATAKTGYQFSGWSSTGSVSVANTSSATTTMTATGTGTVTANFTDVTATRRIYFDNSKVGWSQPYAYAFDANQVVYSAYWPGTKMTLYKGKVWYIDVSTAATKIIFSSGSNTAQTPNLTIPASGTYTMPTIYGFTGTSGTGSWSEYTESTSSNVKSATLDASITGNSNLYTNIDATFYDYYTANEYNNGYLSILDDEGWFNGVPSNNYYRNPYKQFNQSLSEYAQKNNVALPMYYLAEYYQGSGDGSAWYHGQGYYNESSQNTQNGIGKYINDSNQLGDNHKAVTGLSGLTLDEGNIHHYKSGATNQNGAVMAMFDEEWLTSRTQGTAAANNDNYTYGGTLATIVNTKFPVTKTTYTANTYDKVYLDISSQTWWAGTSGVKIMAHLYNSTSDYLDVEMDHDGGNIYSVESTGYSYVVFYRYGWENGNLMWINQTPNLTIPASNNRDRRYYPNAQRAYDGRNNAMCYYSGGDTTWLDHSSAHYMEGGQDYYQFNSTGGRDNIWFTNLTATDGTQPKLFYGAGKNNATKNGYNGLYSFMPFDHGGTGRDMGFGMKLEIDFTLGPDGQLVDPNNSNHKIDQVFNFSGDDDLWVYVDDQLVLDLGGAHAKTDGSINFHTKQATATPAASTVVNSASRNGSFTLADKEVHKMTIFYTERGLHESNLKFGFNFAPVDTDLKVNKVVSPANVNPGLRTDVLNAAANDSFTVNHYYGTTRAAAEAKTNNIGSGVKYTLTDKNNVQTAKTTAAGGTYPIKDRETAQFANVLHKATYLNKYFDLQETFAGNNVYQYTPDFTAKDRENGNVLPTFAEAADGSGGSFLFNNYAQSAVVGDMTPVNLDATFTNRINTKNLIISQHVFDDYGDPNDTFEIKVEVDVDGNRYYYGMDYGFEAYPLTYFGNTSGTMDGWGTNAGTVLLHADDTIIIPGIPENASVRVTEIDMDDAYAFDSMDVTGGTKGGDVANGVWLTMTSDVEVDINNSSGGFLTITHDLYPAVEQEEPSAAKCAVSAKVKDGAATVAVFDETLDPLVIGPDYIKPSSTNTIEITLRTYDVDTANGWTFTKFWENITSTMRALAAQGLLATVGDVTTNASTQETTVVINTGAVSNLFNADKEQTTDWLPFYSELQPRENWTCTIHYHYPVERNTWTAEDDCLWDEQIETVTCDIDDDFMDDFVKGSINDKVDFYLPNEVFEAYRDDKYTIDILLQVLAPQEESPAEITWNLSKIIEDGVTVYQYHPPLSVKPVTIFNDAQNKAVEIDVYGNLPAGFHLPVGDVNLDGSVNVRDVTAIQRYLADLAEIPDELRILADTDGNGIVNITDATWLQLYLAEFVDTLGKQQ